MLSHGDEIARTQRGNNNAYAQDNEISWVNWDLDEQERALLEFTRHVIAVRQASPVLRRRHFFRGQAIDEGGNKDVTWIAPGGGEMTSADWRDAAAHAIGMLIHGEATDETDARGRPVQGDSMLWLLNGGPHPVHFHLPSREEVGQWMPIIDTSVESQVLSSLSEAEITLAPYALVLLRYGVDRRISPESAAMAARAGTDLAGVSPR
jgi:glycogen operon protein